jgi:hypothetical protein
LDNLLNKTMENTATHLQFGQNHMPSLDAGDYQLKVTQTLTDGDGHSATYEKTLDFSVQGDRFAVRPTDVHSVFPPANGLGEYAGVLPHIVLKRSTLPWERDAQDGNEIPPWLALLVFDPSELEVMTDGEANNSQEARIEAETGYSLEAKDLKAGGFAAKAAFAAAAKAWPGTELETGELEEDRVSVIFVKKKNLVPLLPTLDDLTRLAHVRRGTDAQGDLQGEEMAVIISKRLPKAASNSIVHLVSVEKRYGATGFNFQEAGDEDPIPFVSLQSWRFKSVSSKHTFRGLLLHLNQVPVFRVPASTDLNLILPQQGVSSKLRGMFSQVGHPLGKDGVTQNTDRAKREIVLKDYHFLIGNSGKVYDQAGYLLFQMEGITKDADKLPSAIIVQLIKKQGYDIPDNTVVDNLPVRHWWLMDTATNREYYIRSEQGYIEALQLELDHAPTLRLPETGHPVADQFLHQGFVPLPHYPRRGGKTVSWYRGPLATSEKRTGTLEKDIFSVRTSDELIIYHTNAGMFDVSYAAAWELGRLLALRSKRFSVGLHKWRRTHARAAMQEELHEAHLHLPLAASDTAGTTDFPPILHEWLNYLWDLEGIPFNYLVPDERLLPPESLRFFSLDPDWMTCLVHGAFSIGRDAGADHWKEAHDDHPMVQHLKDKDPISGFLLKSEVVSGYPGMQIEVYSRQAGLSQRLTIVKRQLSPDVILCLFTGEAKEVRFHLAPDVLHFGFEENEGALTKYPHDPEGKEKKESIAVQVNEATRVVELDDLFKAIKKDWGNPEEFGSGHFALALMEGAQQVVYLRNGVKALPPGISKFPIPAGTRLQVDEKYYAETGSFYLVFQSDGNLVVYQGAENRFIWGSHQNGAPLKCKRADLDENGNLVLYDANDQEVWSIKTSVNHATLGVNKSGALVMISPNNELVTGDRSV